MHPFFTQPGRLGVYLLGWIPLTAILGGLLVLAGGLSLLEAATLVRSSRARLRVPLPLVLVPLPRFSRRFGPAPRDRVGARRRLARRGLSVAALGDDARLGARAAPGLRDAARPPRPRRPGRLPPRRPPLPSRPRHPLRARRGGERPGRGAARGGAEDARPRGRAPGAPRAAQPALPLQQPELHRALSSPSGRRKRARCACSSRTS